MFQADKSLSSGNKTRPYAKAAQKLREGAKQITIRRCFIYLRQEDDDKWCGCALGAMAYGYGLRKHLAFSSLIYNFLVDRGVPREVVAEIENRFEYSLHSTNKIADWLETL